MATLNAIDTTTLTVTGMTCGACALRVERALAEAPGVHAAEVDVARGSATISYDPSATTPGALAERVRSAGYGASLSGGHCAAPAPAVTNAGCCTARSS